jgi:DMSO/TMAO reductase YedYZ molybdopterin-dependent catalytic subunit
MISARQGTIVAASAGAAGAGLALAVGELITAFDGGGPSLITAVGDEFIDRFAASLKDIAVALFGTADKVALVVGIVIVSLAVGALLGVAGRRRRALIPAGFGAFGILGAWAYAQAPQTSAALGVVAATIAAGTGIVTLSQLLRLVPAGRVPAPLPPTDGPDLTAPPTDAPRRAEPIPRPGVPTRRAFLATGVVGAAAAGVGLSSMRLRTGDPAAVAARETVLPQPGVRAVEPNQPFSTPGQTPWVTPNAGFYRIDTAITVPRVNASSWKLTVDGMVDRPFSLTYDELLAMDSVEEFVTLRCVSDEIGGDLVGNAKWQGVPLAALLERAGVQTGAGQIVGHSVDGWTGGFPTEAASDGRQALVAFAMNGVPLPARHGYPARLVIAGLYGYVSATKWLERIELTTWDGFDGYWVPRGWSKEGPQKIGSRVDVPDREVPSGRVALAGVAWAPVRGIKAVDVQVDDGPWLPCRLGAVTSGATWVQWVHEWDATPGEHVVRARATATDGEVQTSEIARPDPDGATGLHERRFRVTS